MFIVQELWGGYFVAVQLAAWVQRHPVNTVGLFGRSQKVSSHKKG